MKTIWTIIGVIVLIAIIILVYKKATANKNVMQVSMPSTIPTGVNPTKNLSTVTTQRDSSSNVIIQPVPVIINNTGVDCNSQTYQNGVLALYDTYRQKRVIYNNAISTNDPNVFQYHQDLNDAYNAYLNEADKCKFYVS